MHLFSEAVSQVTNVQMVTVVFTDMVGSTELSSRLGPESADALRQTHFASLRQALAATQGTEVKSLGDGLMAVFSSPSAALACAVAMQQTVEKDNRDSGDAIGLRVGLSCGEASVEEGDYFADPVVEAARVEAQRCLSNCRLASPSANGVEGQPALAGESNR